MRNKKRKNCPLLLWFPYWINWANLWTLGVVECGVSKTQYVWYVRWINFFAFWWSKGHIFLCAKSVWYSSLILMINKKKGADVSQCNFNNSKNTQIQQNFRNFWTNNDFFKFILRFWLVWSNLLIIQWRRCL